VISRHPFLDIVLTTLAGLTMFYAYLRVLATEYIITSSHIYAQYGVISRNITQARPEAVVAVNVEQGILCWDTATSCL
jgi:uncharacterized membrane protein YdbT with pleckstrin-like domain